MSNTFDYDWFCGQPFDQQRLKARQLCALKKFPDVSLADAMSKPEFQALVGELEVRVLVYLRDGFSYEMREIVDVGMRGMLTFECEPVDEQYKVGSFIVSVLFEEIVRVEVFAVHPSEKPDDAPIITGFRNRAGEGPGMRDDIREGREPRGESVEY